MARLSLTLRQFKERSRRGNVVPLFREILGDTLTPISIFRSLGGDRAPNSFLLESVINGEQLGRHSFIGVSPRGVLRGRDGRFAYLPLEQGGASASTKKGRTMQRSRDFSGEPLFCLEQILADIQPVPDERLPAFYGGAVGFVSYDTIRYYEDLPDENPDPLSQEDVYLLLTDELVIVDHVERNVRIVVNVHTEEFTNPEDGYRYAQERIAFLEKRIRDVPPPDELKTVKGRMPIASNMTATEYKDIVRKAKDYIREGDIFQVVLSKRFSFQPGVPPFQVYRGLRSINPSPYMYYLNLGPYKIVGSSPEILVRLKDRRVAIRPIAGTRRRGKTKEDDMALEKELLSDTKEIAEHIMLVDLGRNDAGRVCKTGTVEVTDFKTIERYSHVMHIVSHCEGSLREEVAAFDALRYSMPAGTVSGAPKIRAMEIIDELENVRRGIYAGSIGFFGYSRDFDVAIAIRTMIFTGEECHLQAGAGIVFDSDPEMECQEVANKVRGMLAAVRFARRGLQ